MTRWQRIVLLPNNSLIAYSNFTLPLCMEQKLAGDCWPRLGKTVTSLLLQDSWPCTQISSFTLSYIYVCLNISVESKTGYVKEAFQYTSTPANGK